MSKETFNIIDKIESDESVRKARLKGVPLWELIRYKVYLHLESKQNNLINSGSLTFFQKVVQIVRLAILSNPFFYLTTVDYLIIRCSRKVVFKGTKIDVYTAHLEIDPKAKLGAYETSFDGDVDSGVPHIYFFSFISSLFAKLISFFYRPGSAEIEKLVGIIEEDVSDLDLRNLISNEYFKFNIGCFLYSLLLKIRKPKAVFLTNYIDKLSLIFAAKKLNIRTIEIQHGFTAPALLLYHYPRYDDHEVLLFPDEYYYLEEDYFLGCKLPISNDVIKKLESPFFEDKRLTSGVLDGMEERNILFVSQHLLHKRFFTFFKEFVSERMSAGTGPKVYYKPHPNEYAMFTKTDMHFFTEHSPTVVFLGKNEDLFKVLGSVTVVVGVYSTFLLEAKEKGKNVILLDIPGVEYFEEIAQKYQLNIAKSGRDLLDLLLTEG